MAIITVYDLLEVKEDASKEEIEKSYQRLVNEYKVDPSKSKEENNDNAFILEKLKLAYAILSNDEKRKKYDVDLAKKRAEELIENVTIKPEENANLQEEIKPIENVAPEKKSAKQEVKPKKEEKPEEKYVEEYDEETEIQLTDDEKQKLKKAAEKEFKENLKKAQKVEEEYNRAYNEAYNNYLRKMGYTVKEPWTWKRIKNVIIYVIAITITCALIWYLPITRNLLIQVYEENFIVKSLVDIVVMIVNAITSVFK